jgi:hypothetical protein
MTSQKEFTKPKDVMTCLIELKQVATQTSPHYTINSTCLHLQMKTIKYKFDTWVQ